MATWLLRKFWGRTITSAVNQNLKKTEYVWSLIAETVWKILATSLIKSAAVETDNKLNIVGLQKITSENEGFDLGGVYMKQIW